MRKSILIAILLLVGWGAMAQNNIECNDRTFVEAIVADDTVPSNEMPFYTSSDQYVTGGCAVVVTVVELAHAGIYPGSEIKSISLWGASYGTMTVHGVDVYLSTTGASEVAQKPNVDTMTHVLHLDSITFAHGKNTLEFDTPYPYTGSGNLVISFRRTGGFDNVFAFCTKADRRSISYFSLLNGSGSIQSISRLRMGIGVCAGSVGCLGACFAEASTTEADGVYYANLSWASVGDSNELEYTYYGYDLDNPTHPRQTLFTPYDSLNFLIDAGTCYSARVRTHCGGDTTSWGYLTFQSSGTRPKLCDSSWTANLSNGTSSGNSTNVPYEQSTGYTEGGSWTIISAAEMAGMGILAGQQLSRLEYRMINGSAASQAVFYMASTPLSAVTSLADTMPFAQMTPVGELHTNSVSGWQSVNFHTPYTYDGGNLMIGFRRIGKSPTGSRSYTSNAGKSVSYYRNSSGTNIYILRNVRSQMRLSVCIPKPECDRPAITSIATTDTSATIRWSGSASNFEVVMGTPGFDPDTITFGFPLRAIVSDTSYTFRSLPESTPYDVYVRGLCQDTSWWSPVRSTRTRCSIATIPYMTSFNASEVDSCWVLHGGAERMSLYGSDGNELGMGYQLGTAVLPMIDAPINTLKMRMIIYSPLNDCPLENNMLVVGVVTNPRDESTFISYDTLPLSAMSCCNGHPHESFAVNMSDYSGPEGRIAFRGRGEPWGVDIDSLVVDTVSVCPKPGTPVVSDISASGATLHWDSHHSHASAYEVEFQSHDTTLRFVVYDTLLQPDNLNHSTGYSCRVRAICTDGDSGYWSNTARFHTSCLPIDRLPYEAERANFTLGDNPPCWVYGEGTIGNQHLHYMTTPEIDTNLCSMDQLRLEFDIQPIVNRIFLGVMNGDSDTNSFVAFDTLLFDYGLSNVHHCVAYCTLRQGNRLAFGIPGNNLYGFNIYDLTVSRETCHPVTDLAADSMGTYEMKLSWTSHGTPVAWDIAYDDGSTVRHATATSNPYLLTGLDPLTSYYVSVRSICAPGDTSQVESGISCRTLPDSLHAITRVEFGGTFYNDYHVPADRFYHHSWTQMVYPVDSIDVRGVIDTVWFRCKNTGSNFADTSVNLYLGHAPHSVAQVAQDWVPMDSLVLVKHAVTLAPTLSGWYAIPLDRTFYYNGNSPLAVVMARSSDIYTNTQTHYCYDAPMGATLFRVSDDSVSYASHPMGAQGTMLDRLASIRLSFLQSLQSCPHVKNLHVESSLHHDVELAWSETGSASEWQIHVRTEEGDIDSTLIVTSNPYTVTDLPGEHTYQFEVRPICGEGDTGYYYGLASHHLISCPAPDYLEAMHVQDSQVTIGWRERGDASEWIVTYATGENSQEILTNSTLVTLSGLMPASEYHVTVRTICGAGDTSVADSVTFTTLDDMNEAYVVVSPVGESGTSTNYPPINSFFNHSYTQMIYTAEEIGRYGRIDTLWFNCSNVGSGALPDTLMTFYLGHTALRTVTTDATNWVPAEDLQMVYRHTSASPRATGWFAVPLDTPFFYNGVENLAVVCSFHGNWTTSWKYQQVNSDVRCMRRTSDDYYDYGEHPGNNNASGTYATLPLMRLSMRCQYQDICVAPHDLTGIPIAGQAAMDVDWVDVSNNNQWQLVATSADGSDTLIVNTHPYRLQLPVPGKEYSLKVRAVCDSNSFSAWATAPAQMVGLTMVPQQGSDTITTCDVVIADCGGLDGKPYDANGRLTIYPAQPGAMIHLGGWVRCAHSGMTFRVYDGASTSDSLLASYNNSYNDAVDVFSTHGPLTLEMISTAQSTSLSNTDGLELRAQCFSTDCDIPRYLAADNLTTTTALVSWRAMFGASNFELRYAEDGHPFGPVIQLSDTTQIELNGLTANTQYRVEVRTLCPDGGASEWAELTFSTECGVIDVLPYSDDFESYAVNEMPTCWIRIGDNAKVAAGVGRNSSKGLRIQDRAISSSVSPTVSLTRIDRTSIDLDNTDFHFWCRYSGYDSRTVEVGLMTDPTSASTFVPFDTLSVGRTYAEFTIPLSGIGGSGEYLSLRVKTLYYSSEDYYCMDDFRLVEHQCTAPTAISVRNNINSDNVMVSWTDPSVVNDVWELAYGPTGFDPDTSNSTLVSYSTSATLGGLLPNADYDLYVRSYCSSGQPSDWFGPQQLPHVGQHWLQHGSDTITTCGGHIYDLGGPNGYYYSGYNDTLVIFPATEGNNVKIMGHIDRIISSGDTLIFYEGVGTDGLLLGKFYGYNTDFGPVTSNEGPMTFVFRTYRYSNSANGFDLTVSCEEQSGCRLPGNLRATAIRDSSARVNWSNYEQDATPTFAVAYGLASTFDTANSATFQLVTGVTDTFCNLTGLMANTQYAFAVKTICDPSSQSRWTSPKTFTTCCAALSTLPFVENFDSYSNVRDISCWDFFGEGVASLPNIYGTTDKYLDFNHWEGSYTCAVLPLMADPIQNLKVSFDLRPAATYGAEFTRLEVGVIETVGDISSFTPIETLTPSGHDNQRYTIYLGTYTGQGGRIAFYRPIPQGYDNGYAEVDDLLVELVETCPPPQQIALDVVDTDQVTLHWTETGTATQWTAECCAYGVPRGSGVFFNVTGVPTVSFYGLTPGSQYRVYVSPMCDDSAVSSIGFSTLCGSAEPLPYVENFDSYDNYEMPNCWMEILRTTYSGSYYPRVMNHTLQLENTSAIATPRLNAPANSLVVDFDLKCTRTNPPYFVVGFLSDDSVFYSVDSVQVADGIFHHFSIPFSSLATTEIGRVVLRQCTPFWSMVNTIDNLVVTMDANHQYYAATAVSNDEILGRVEITQGGTVCNSGALHELGATLCFEAVPLSQESEVVESRFVMWQDGNADNPRCIVLTQDTIMRAIFALDTLQYLVEVSSNDTTLGTATVAVSAKNSSYFMRGGMLTFTATPKPQSDTNLVARFVSWNDGNTDNPRSFVLTQDTVLMAFFVCDTITTEGIEAADDAAIVVYPNPVRELLTLVLPACRGEVRLYDLGGREVLYRKIEGDRDVIDVSGLPMGAYLLRATGEWGTAMKKLIIDN